MAWSREPGHRRGRPRQQADRIRSRDNWTCQACGRPDSYEVDHVLNVASGGSDHDDNLQVLCTACHQAKTQREAAAGRVKRSRYREPEPHPGRITR
ncbi:HNH endonuclease [Nocardia cyriacigeorgica]|uniref:HNH endonuclease n=1 Tax=Nocardia cyriacigeorgica TaxID=135487 RepID=A0A6P1CMY3_9NOCA|nr:HNH endonuclease [Nocardia cyriacigeorgica]NEW33828.1 HNH endonuclease [Nocardia cyriacigeorgica]